MIRVCSFLTSALIAFTVGLGVVWGFEQIALTVDLATKISEDTAKMVFSPVASAQDLYAREVIVEVVRLKEQEGKTLAEVLVVNNSTETVFYQGDNKNSNADVWIDQSFSVKSSTFGLCRFGMKKQQLLPGEFATFNIHVTDPQLPFRIGYDFWVGEVDSEKEVNPMKLGRQRKTVWSEWKKL